MRSNEISIELGNWLKATATGDLAVIALLCIVITCLLFWQLRERRSPYQKALSSQAENQNEIPHPSGSNTPGRDNGQSNKSLPRQATH